MYELRKTDNQMVLVLSGSVSISDVAPLRKELQTLDATQDLIVDASGLDYIDSSGIACLIFAYSARAKQGARVMLQNPSESLMRVLETLKFSSFFPQIPQ